MARLKVRLWQKLRYAEVLWLWWRVEICPSVCVVLSAGREGVVIIAAGERILL